MADKHGSRTEVCIALNDIDPVLLLGENDRWLRLLRAHSHARLIARGDTIRIVGEADEVRRIEALVLSLMDLVRSGHTLQQEDMEIALHVPGAANPPPRTAAAEIVAPRRVVRPRTAGQHAYVDAMMANDLVFAIGPAGTGKTYLAAAIAVAALSRHEVRRIVLARPAVEAGEKLGYLPGDLKEKVDPYLRPLWDALYDLLPLERVKRLMTLEAIEIVPLAFMRGRTLNDSYVILDEAQNTTPMQMKMFLTRLGNSSKAIVTGDVTQIDLPPGQISGLLHIRQILPPIPGIAFVELTRADVVRHPLVQRIVQAYEELERDG
ncbi:PhoH family protein [Candidatus Fermentibacteria bacterium]|nr:PhoH family protein [Candidatus Fermentibacteria bacterium]